MPQVKKALVDVENAIKDIDEKTALLDAEEKVLDDMIEDDLLPR